MSAAQLVTALVLLAGSLTMAPDLHWALESLAWSVLGFMAGVGAGYLLWGGTDR